MGVTSWVRHTPERVCRHCGTTRRLTIDRVIPVALGGPTVMENLQILCQLRDSRKGVTV